MNGFEHWKSWFRDWPEKLPRDGIVVTIAGDHIPFNGFLAAENMLLLQRPAPDAIGTRQVLLPYQRIDSIKLTQIVDAKVFTQAGFDGTLPKR